MVNSPSSRNKGGFSLVEVTIALGIVSFCVIAVLGLSVLTYDQTQGAKRDVTWTNIANEVILKIRSTTWSTSTLPAQEFHFDIDGKAVSSSSNEAVYICKATEIAGDLPHTPAGTSSYKKSILLEMGMTTSKEKFLIPMLISQYD